MFHSLTGTLIQSSPRQAVVSCGGVGFSCNVSLNTAAALPSLGEAAMLFTHLAVREDALELYGFSTETELDLFRRLITVSGVGAKVAMQILSSAPPDRVMLCIAAGDAAALKAPGVGPKLAARIIMELQGKLGDVSPALAETAAITGSAGAAGEAAAALAALGYSPVDAASAIAKCDKNASVEEVIKQSLKLLSRQ